RGVALERLPNQCSLFRMRFDTGHPGAIGLYFDVPSRCKVRPSSLQDFLAHALFDFIREVARVELGDGRHDVFDELTRDGFVDVLDDRREPDLMLFEERADHGVVVYIPGQSVDLVHEYHIWTRVAPAARQ